MKIKFCPECKSENIEINPTVDQAAFGFHQTHKCADCGYENIVFPEKEK